MRNRLVFIFAFCMFDFNFQRLAEPIERINEFGMLLSHMNIQQKAPHRLENNDKVLFDDMACQNEYAALRIAKLIACFYLIYTNIHAHLV